MNIKREPPCGAQGLGKCVILVLGAFMAALPFMTKNLVSLPGVNALCSIFGWCGIAPLFMQIFDFKKSLKRVLCSLFCFFYAFYFFAYSWLVNLYPLDFAGLGNAESIGVIIIAMTAIPLIHASLMTACMLLGYVSARELDNAFIRAILVSFGYVLGEFSQSLGTLAFPWVRLFVGQTANLPLLQSASLFGSYFITFIMVLVNAFVALSLINIKKSRRKSAAFALVALCIFSINLIFGLVRISKADLSAMEQRKVVVLQGNIPSGEKWSGSADEKEIYLELAKSYEERGADIAVMPETAFPVTLYPDDGFTSETEKLLFEIADALDAELFAGAFAYEDRKSYNSVFVLDKNGFRAKPYHKTNIVPFGEFLPYRSIVKKLVPSLAQINMLSSDLSRGEGKFPVEAESGEAACLVCFDSVFSENARLQVKNGGQFIVIATNDSWYKASAAIYQHADHAIMRAIENNVPVVRSANTGISRIIDSYGRVVKETKVNERTVMGGEIYIPREKSLYTRTGELVVPTALVSIFVCLIIGFARRKKASRS